MKNPRKDGLHLMYVGNLVALISIVLMVIPIVNIVAVIAGLVGAVVSIVGLVKLRDQDKDYMNAIVALVVGVVVGLFPGAVFDAVSAIANLAMVYFVIRATNQLLDNVGHPGEPAYGDRAWKWELLAAVVGIVCDFLASMLPVVGLVFAIVSLVVSVIAVGMYVDYLKRSSEAM